MTAYNVRTAARIRMHLLTNVLLVPHEMKEDSHEWKLLTAEKAVTCWALSS